MVNSGRSFAEEYPPEKFDLIFDESGYVIAVSPKIINAGKPNLNDGLYSSFSIARWLLEPMFAAYVRKRRA